MFFAGNTSWCLIHAIVWLVHLLAGAPEIFMTVLPKMIAGAFFSFGYAKRVALYLLPRS